MADLKDWVVSDYSPFVHQAAVQLSDEFGDVPVRELNSSQLSRLLLLAQNLKEAADSSNPLLQRMGV